MRFGAAVWLNRTTWAELIEASLAVERETIEQVGEVRAALEALPG